MIDYKIQISTSKQIVKLAKIHSKDTVKCPRPVEGSISHAFNLAIIEWLEKRGCIIDRF